MRVNVYGEEITGEVRIVQKDGHYGLRFYLKSHGDLHFSADDDDRSAVTFWGLSVCADLVVAACIVMADFVPGGRRDATGAPAKCNGSGDLSPGGSAAFPKTAMACGLPGPRDGCGCPDCDVQRVLLFVKGGL